MTLLYSFFYSSDDKDNESGVQGGQKNPTRISKKFLNFRFGSSPKGWRKLRADRH